MGTNTRRHS